MFFQHKYPASELCTWRYCLSWNIFIQVQGSQLLNYSGNVSLAPSPRVGALVQVLSKFES